MMQQFRLAMAARITEICFAVAFAAIMGVPLGLNAADDIVIETDDGLKLRVPFDGQAQLDFRESSRLPAREATLQCFAEAAGRISFVEMAFRAVPHD